jgi:XapX domain-containing protein
LSRLTPQANHRLPQHNHRGVNVKIYIVSTVLGLIVGAFYALVNVRSPAPPPVALVGLLAIFVGQQAMAPLVARFHPAAISDRSAGSEESAVPSRDP